MQLWVGLGNPGATYAMHRHNIGFMAIDALAEINDLPLPAKKFLGWVQELRIGSDKIILLKPATFMNESGRSVRAAMDFYKLEPSDVLGALSAEADWLAKGDDVRFMNDIAMRLQQD